MIAALMIVQAASAQPGDIPALLPVAPWIGEEVQEWVGPYWECARNEAGSRRAAVGPAAAARAGIEACGEEREDLDAALTASGLLWKVANPQAELPVRVVAEALEAVDAAILAALSQAGAEAPRLPTPGREGTAGR
jgi:hypothetical protein